MWTESLEPGLKDRIQMRKENYKHVQTDCANGKFRVVEEH